MRRSISALDIPLADRRRINAASTNRVKLDVIGVFRKDVGSQQHGIVAVMPEHARQSRTTRILSITLWLGALIFTIYQVVVLTTAFASRDPFTSMTPTFRDIPFEMTLHYHKSSINISAAVEDFYWNRMNITSYLKILNSTCTNLTEANNILRSLLESMVYDEWSYTKWCGIDMIWHYDSDSVCRKALWGNDVPQSYTKPGYMNWSNIIVDKVINEELLNNDRCGFRFRDVEIDDAYMSIEYDGKKFVQTTVPDILLYMAESVLKSSQHEHLFVGSVFRIEPYVTSCSIAARVTVSDLNRIGVFPTSCDSLISLKFYFKRFPSWIIPNKVYVAFGSGSNRCAIRARIGLDWVTPGKQIDPTDGIHTFFVQVTQSKRDRLYCNPDFDKQSIEQYCFRYFAKNGSSCVPYLGQDFVSNNVKTCSVPNTIEYARRPFSTLPDVCKGNYHSCYFKSGYPFTGHTNPWCKKNFKAVMDCITNPSEYGIDTTPCSSEWVNAVYERSGSEPRPYEFGDTDYGTIEIRKQSQPDILVVTKPQLTLSWLVASIAGQLSLFLAIAERSNIIYIVWLRVKILLRKIGLLRERGSGVNVDTSNEATLTNPEHKAAAR